MTNAQPVAFHPIRALAAVKEDAVLGTSRESGSLGSGAEEERQAAARSSLYGLFQDALAYPDDEVREALAGGELVELMRKGLALVEVDFTPPEECWRALREVGSTQDLAPKGGVCFANPYYCRPRSDLFNAVFQMHASDA
jgi:hypothetical protein